MAIPVDKRNAGKMGAAQDSQVGVIRIEGTITGSTSQGWMTTQGSAGQILEQLRAAQKDTGVKAVVIRVNSPGGSAAAAQEIVEEIQRLRQSGKVVVVSMGDMAASAGYWIAAQADTVVANPTTLTGSIGVIMQWENLEELFKKLGISSEVIKSGAFKDIGSATRPLTEEERELLQGLVDDTYQQFFDDVALRREGKITRERLAQVADGRVFTGRQAKELGLVDELGNFYDAVDKAGALAGIEGEPKLKEYSTETALERFFSGLSSMAPGGGVSDLTRGQWWPLLWKGVFNEPGKSYRVE
ncbi:MAG: signal peptide peptidase SppA [Firmicutes bacterium]|nr:signal peptide peptidase SppA [Bacillota bacterium]